MRFGGRYLIDFEIDKTLHYLKQVFDFEFIRGNQHKPYNNLNSAIITESNAQMIFGDDDPIGKELVFGSQHTIAISGVIKDLPSNSSFEIGSLG